MNCMSEQLPAEAIDMCGRLATSMWRRIRNSTQRTFDYDDIHQEAMLAAWIRLRDEPETPPDLLYTITMRRVIDWMRQAGDIGRKDRVTEEYKHSTPLSLDEASEGTQSIAETLLDPRAEEDYIHVDEAHDLDLAFDAYRGSPRAADVAYLATQGITLAEIGAHFGVTESRACQLRNAFIADVRQAWRIGESSAA